MRFHCDKCGRDCMVEVLPQHGPNVPAGAPEIKVTPFVVLCPVCGSEGIKQVKPETVEEAVQRGARGDVSSR